MARILVIGSLAESLVTFRKPLFEEMVSHGHDVVACAPDATKQVKDTLIGIGVKYQDINLKRTGLNPVRDLQTIINLIRLFKKIKPDVFLGYTIKPVVYGSFAARLTGVPDIFSMIEGAGYAFSGSGLKNRIIGLIAKNLYQVTLKYNRKVFFLNTDDVDLFLQKRLIKSRKQSVLLNGIGVDLELFNTAPYPKEVSFLLVARLLRDKGVCEYVQAARIIRQKYPEIKFRLVGFIDEGNPVSITKEELNSWVDSGVIEYIGKLSDVRPAYASSSVYVLPSYHEGMPVTVMEAMAMARPIITTEAPGCRETVQQGDNGILVPVKDVGALVEAIVYFIQRPEKIQIMGQASRRIAEAKYDVHNINALILRTMELA